MNQQLYASKSLNYSHFLRIPQYFWSGIKYNAAGKLYTAKPLLASITVTHRCNSRCQMCDFWREKNNAELTPRQIVDIFRSPLFSSVERITLSGGEPTLRDDLEEIIQLVINILPKVKEVTLCTNGLDTNRVVEQVKRLIQTIRTKEKCILSISTSLDDMGPLHEKIRRVPNAFERIDETISRLQQLQKVTPFYLSATCVVQPVNMYDLLPVVHYARHIKLPMTFVPICTAYVLDRKEREDNLEFSAQQHRDLKNIFIRDIYPHLSVSNKPFWQQYFKIIEGEKRKIPCFMQNHFVNIKPDGSLRLCSADNYFILGNSFESTPEKLWYSRQTKKLKKTIKTKYCQKCTIHCDEAFSLKHEFFYFANYYLKEKLGRSQ